MPKPTQPIADKITLPTGIDLETLTPRAMYVLTYNSKICQVRRDENIINKGYKYLRNIWTDEGTAISQTKKLNKLFKTTLFDYKKIV